ncbi:MAG: glycosyltransferase family 2 protein [Candidatus Altiarchaeota archaeon]|nr:glycosyltransferase family 2 protein [Candidatus Altiarchaeota archaeon]
MKNKYLVVIPAYNEEKTIKEVIQRTLPYADIVVVNDASKDKTAEIVKSFKNVVLINHPKNTHIPQAVLDGMQYAYDNGYDYILTMDAGLSHKPEEIPDLLNAPECDLVLSYRGEKKHTPLYRKVLSKAATTFINIALWRFQLTKPIPAFKDVTSGYRRYSKEAVELLLKRESKAKSFDFLTESLMFIYRNNMKIIEVPITYEFSNSSLNKKVVKDSISMLLDILLHNRK